MVSIGGCTGQVGFGFLDNSIMLLAGDAIECTLAVKFGISTMACCALGNIVGDVRGRDFAGCTEQWTQAQVLHASWASVRISPSCFAA